LTCMVVGSGSSSPVTKPSYVLPEIPNISGNENQRPGSSQCQTINDRHQGEYTIAPPKINTNSHSAPASPGHSAKYNVSFSPRITFHDTWPSGEYDRRGEVATCNRLTPLLAQQIKEELNTFKMVRRSNSMRMASVLIASRRWMFMRSQKYTRISSNDPVQ
jgi:hypothetical protein